MPPVAEVTTGAGQKSLSPEPAPSRPKILTKAKASKLQNELPQIVNVEAAPVLASVVGAALFAGQPVEWIAHTKLELRETGTHSELVGKKLQSPQVQSVINTAGLMCQRHILFQTNPNPFQATGPNEIVSKALFAVCKRLDFMELGDIYDRLERDNPKLYFNPLRAHCVAAFTSFRLAFKKDGRTIIHSMLGFNATAESTLNAARVAARFEYMFPTGPAGKLVLKPEGLYTPAVFKEYISKVLFAPKSTSYKCITHFHRCLLSTSEDAPDELELPPSMVALAGAVIHNVILEHARGGSVDFCGVEMAGVYQKHLDTLEKLFESKPVVYHTLMHSFYTAAMGADSVSSGQTQTELLDAISWVD
ncbi:hypothetical protein BDZ89DRAFT_444564 [Hymenopellis radicata]|nr:hypothetical protein BDZ89DRAFT_444564 [Hymenopellis radicata]